MTNLNRFSPEDIRRAKAEIAKVLGIDEKYIHYPIPDKDSFYITQAIVAKEDGLAYLDNRDTSKRLYISKFDFLILEKYPISFKQCDFDCYINHYAEQKIGYLPFDCNPFSFDNCRFLKSFSLNLSYLQIYRCVFENCHFQGDVNISFKFSQDTYFSNCIFEEKARFKKSVFEKNISFYGSTFKQCPNFAQCRFEGNVNLVNTNLQFDYKSIKTEIEKEAGIYQYEVGNTYYPNTIANDLRDSFRFFKNTLSKEGNLLNASSYHKVELYCKEIEFDSMRPKLFSKEWIEKCQLWFYRQTSDHHTDILKSFNSLVALIGIFGLLCGAVVWGFNYFIFDCREGINILKLKEAYSSHIMASIKNNISGYFLGNLVLVFVFLGLFWSMVWKHSRNLFVFLGYCTALIFFAISPKYLVPAMSFFDSKRALLDPICTLGGLYTLLFGFLAYSFIKTIRKNSIIPS